MSASRLLYGTTVFLGAFLLFLVEPMAAKQLLPVLGGSSAVWLTCLVFFQVTLLLGYLYAHWLTRATARSDGEPTLLSSPSVAAIILLAAQGLSPSLIRNGSDHPVTTIFLSLALTIGLPFLLLGATSPLLQMWFLRTEGGSIPYRLFALSNAGSLLALIAYPILVEPNLTLKHQRALWSLGFLLYAVLCILLARQIRQPVTDIGPSTRRGIANKRQPSTKWLWFLLPMAAAMQLSAVTAHLTVNIAAIPLLWMLPLAAYLLTFILAFEFPALYRRGIVVRLLVVMLASLGYAISKTDVSLPIGIAILFFLAECFLAGLFCHAETYTLRPQRRLRDHALLSPDRRRRSSRNLLHRHRQPADLLRQLRPRHLLLRHRRPRRRSHLERWLAAAPALDHRQLSSSSSSRSCCTPPTRATPSSRSATSTAPSA